MNLATDQIDRKFTDFAWRLWSTLGVAGDSPQYPECFIDLEALIILTSVLGKSDPRLLDEALDWCSNFHNFVSISRLRTLIDELEPLIGLPFSTFAESLNSLSQAKWPTFVKATSLRKNLSRKSQPPNCKLPALLSLRLRSLLGVGARADLATYFLTEQPESFTAADTVEIGYNKRTMADTLDYFLQGGLLTCSMNRNQKEFQIAKKTQLANFAGEIPHLVPNWRSIIVVFITLRDLLIKHQNHSTASTVVAIRNALDSLKDHLQKLNITPLPLSSDLTHWDVFVQWTIDTLKGLVDEEHFKCDHFEENLFLFIQHIYKIDDCIDGLLFIINCSSEHPSEHQKIFKECYQMSTCYLEELQSRIEDLLKFPIHLFMDIKLSEIIHKYSIEQIKQLIQLIKNKPSTKELSLSGAALNWHKTLETELRNTIKFINEIKKQLRELNFQKTNTHLLTQSTTLLKRHAVLKLFSLS